MNFFSSRLFASAAGRAFFPGQVLRQRTCRAGGRCWCLPQFGDQEPAVDLPFLEFFEPMPVSAASSDVVSLIPRGLHLTIRADQWPAMRSLSHEVAPLIDWRYYGSFAAFRRHAAIGRDRAGLSRNPEMRLESELGPLEFRFHDWRPEAFEQALAWKSVECVAAGSPDPFAQAANVVLFRELLHSGALCVPTLEAGGRLVAADLSVEHDRRYYSWIATSDPELAELEPGRVLLERVIEESSRLQHEEFDFLLGDDEYKWVYASHARVVGPIGAHPLSRKLVDRVHSLNAKLRRAA